MTKRDQPAYNKFNYNEWIAPVVYFIEFNVDDKLVKNHLILFLKNYKQLDLKTAKDLIKSAKDNIVRFGFSDWNEWKRQIDLFSEIMPPNVSWRIYCDDFLRGEKNDYEAIAMASN